MGRKFRRDKRPLFCSLYIVIGKKFRYIVGMNKRMILSKITSKCQTVIPRDVRERLDLRPGDHLHYMETEQGIVIEKLSRSEDDPFATFSEWASDADEKAFADL